MLKSALMFSKEKLNFIVVAEDDLIESFNEKVIHLLNNRIHP